MSTWHDDARRLHGEGHTIRQLQAVFNKSATSVRCAVDPEYLAKQLEQNRKVKERQRLRSAARAGDIAAKRTERVRPEKGARISIEPRAQPIDRSVQHAYADKPAKKQPSMPRISLALLPEEPVLRKYAPRIVVREESPGARRWREHHERMIRSGRIAPAGDLLAEWRA